MGAHIRGIGPHTITVDKVNSAFVYIRDPLSVSKGSSYAVKREDFSRYWKRTTTTGR